MLHVNISICYIPTLSKTGSASVPPAGESGSGPGLVWRETETHRQKQHPSSRRPAHADRWRPRTGKESDVTGRRGLKINL